MRKIRAMAGVAALALITSACSGGESESAEPAEAAEPAAEETATEEEAPAEEAATEDGAAAEGEETAAAGAGDAMATADGVAFASLTGDAAKGRVVFAQCQSCHATDAGVNKTGPSLAGIVGRKSGSVDGYNYSPANANSGITWSEEQMYVYLEDPQKVIPKTKMVFPGLRDAQKRADVIAYLKNPS